jgi:hypothetical protein
MVYNWILFVYSRFENTEIHFTIQVNKHLANIKLN